MEDRAIQLRQRRTHQRIECALRCSTPPYSTHALFNLASPRRARRRARTAAALLRPAWCRRRGAARIVARHAVCLVCAHKRLLQPNNELSRLYVVFTYFQVVRVRRRHASGLRSQKAAGVRQRNRGHSSPATRSRLYCTRRRKDHGS